MRSVSDGVWCVCHHDYYEIIDRIYPTEIDALRQLNEQGYGHVRFMAWGKDFADMDGDVQ